jgi:hypothetical protein
MVYIAFSMKDATRASHDTALLPEIRDSMGFHGDLHEFCRVSMVFMLLS